MKTIELNILAKDIETTSYMNSYDCAITRAMKRKGIEAQECGGEISNSKNDRIPTPKSLAERVKGMYKFLSP